MVAASKVKEVVHDTWNNCSGSLQCKASMLASSLNIWNKEVYGNIFKQKRVLLARIRGIQKSLGKHDNPFLLKLEKDLILQYDQIRDVEALFWRQKSRDKWLSDGDRNTKFFHLTTKIRRRRNKIDGLFDDAGIWTEDQNSMKRIAASFF